jgi:hypothetical protein
MSVLPTFVVACACALGIALIVYREWRGLRREDREWMRLLDAARREDERLLRWQRVDQGQDPLDCELELLYALPARDPEHGR